MKKSILILGVFGLMLFNSSCKKEIIEIVDQQEDVDFNLMKSGSDGSDLINDDNVTDPNEDEDFNADKKNIIGKGE